MAFPLVGILGKKIVSTGIKKGLPALKKITNPRQTNIDFLSDRGKPDFENFKLETHGFKKHFEKVKENPREVIENFNANISPDQTGEEMNGVNFELPIDDNSGSPENSEEKNAIKTPSPFFDSIGELGNLIKDGRTFGSISLLLLVIIFIVVAIRPVGNTSETRLSLMFKSLLNLTELDGMATEEELEDQKKDGLGVVKTPYQDMLPPGSKFESHLKYEAMYMDGVYNTANSPLTNLLPGGSGGIVKHIVNGFTGFAGKLMEKMTGGNDQ